MNNKNEYVLIKKSLENEMSIDSFLIKTYKLKQKRISYFKVARFRDKIPILLSMILALGTPFYFVIQMIRSLKTQHRIQNSESDFLFFSFTESPKAVELYTDYGNEQPFIQCISGRTLFFIHEIDRKHLIKCYFKSLCYAIRFLISFNPKYCLHVTSIFELVTFNYYLDKLIQNGIKEVTLTNHYDRWISLLSEKGGVKINIIQHGLLAKDFFPKNKLHNINSVRAINEEQLEIFSSNIIFREGFTRLFLKAHLDIWEEDICDVLIISNPFYIVDELAIYQKIKSHNISVRFRPHPLYITSEVLSVVEEDDLCTGKRFPNPKYCLCKSSTLGYEYQAMGYSLIQWDDKKEFETILVLLSK